MTDIRGAPTDDFLEIDEVSNIEEDQLKIFSLHRPRPGCALLSKLTN